MSQSAQIRYDAVTLALSSKMSVTEIAQKYAVSRKTIYAWIKRYNRLANRNKKTGLENSYVRGSAHPRSVAPSASILLKKIMYTHPEYGCRKLSTLLHSKGIPIGYAGVYTMLKKMSMNARQKRGVPTKQFAGRLNGAERLRIVASVITKKRSVASLAREYMIAPKTIYTWQRAYQAAAAKGDYSGRVLSDTYRKGLTHPRYLGCESEILLLAGLHPEYTMRMLAASAGVSVFTVWKMLHKQNFSRKQTRVVRPSFPPLPITLPKPAIAFVPQTAPAPPPHFLTAGIFMAGTLIALFSGIVSSFILPIEIPSNDTVYTTIISPTMGYKKYQKTSNLYQESYIKDKQVAQDLSWGALAFNTNKTVYKPGEEVHIDIGVLNPTGGMDCTSDVLMIVTNPKGEKQQFKTSDSTLSRHPACFVLGRTTTPDYDAFYTHTKHTGTYKIEVLVDAKRAARSVFETFYVFPHEPFSIERKAATRLYPSLTYPVTIVIKANNDFTGRITEHIPRGFSITGTDGVVGPETIVWEKQLKRGETYTFSYTYQPTLLSPDMQTFGPLDFVERDSARMVYTEPGEWQVVVDTRDPNY